MMRVTDLDRFSLEEIWRPYQSLAGFKDRLERSPFDLDETAARLLAPSEWSEHVLSRLDRIGVHFPAYVKHPLVDLLTGRRAALDLARQKEAV